MDEVGRGPLAGPVVAAAVILKKEHGILGLKDSKKLSPKKRSSLFAEINSNSVSIGIGCVDIKVIDEINIKNATLLAMENAIENLSVRPDQILIDGLDKPKIDIKTNCIIKGDSKIDSIMAASIIAKVTRDKMMVKYSKIFFEYGFEKNKGYGTKQHMMALESFMSTPIHRMSFQPVNKYLPTLKWLEDNNRLRWMAQKMTALYLMDLGYEIRSLNYILDKKLIIDVICNHSQKNIFICIKLKNDSVYNKMLDLKLKAEVKNQILNYYKYEDIIKSQLWQIDIIEVDLYNKNSKFEHFEGILSSI